MRAIALDTNTYAGFKRGDQACVEVMQQADRLLLSATVIAELLAGFACGTHEARNRKELRLFLDSPRVGVCASTIATADAYALIYRQLRRAGNPIPTNDIWIAASCQEHGAVLFSYDQHFDAIDGFRVIRTWAEALP